MNPLDFLIAPAHAQAAAGGAPSMMSTLLFPIVLIGIMYFLMIRPQMKRQKEHRALLEKLARGEPPEIFGDGSETKHFVYVGDLARANRMAFESAASNVAVNCSGPVPVTTKELVALVTELAGGGPAPRFVGETVGKVRLTSGGAFRIAHEKAFSAIGWKPEVEMREGLARLIKWLKEGNS